MLCTGSSTILDSFYSPRADIYAGFEGFAAQVNTFLFRSRLCKFLPQWVWLSTSSPNGVSILSQNHHVEESQAQHHLQRSGQRP